MRLGNIFVILLLFCAIALHGFIGKAAILDMTEHNGTSTSYVTSLEHIMQVAGIPYVVTDSLEIALQYSMVTASAYIDNDYYSTERLQLISDYVAAGGIAVVPRISTNYIYHVFGVTGYQSSSARLGMNWAASTSDPSLRWLDDPAETTISFARESHEEIFSTRAYDTTTAAVLATYDDGTAAVTKNAWGMGFAYNIGFALKEVVLRNQLNLDYDAQEMYSNGFEPGTDTFFLFYRGIWQTHMPYAVYKHTSPANTVATLMITHDVDSTTGFDWMLDFAQLEHNYGVKTQYLITTRYFSDDIMGPIYSIGGHLLPQILAYGHLIGSHSVGHFPDFAIQSRFPEGEPGQTMYAYHPYHSNGVTTNANLWGELGVSKDILENDLGVTCQVYRSGHLCFNKNQIKVLDEAGYRYDSTQSANDVLTNFPYQQRIEQSYSGEFSNVWELPMTISDVGFSEDDSTYTDALPSWLHVIERNNNNNAPTVLLIHPNIGWKVTAEEQLINSLPQDMNYNTVSQYGDYWRMRKDLDYTTSVVNDSLYITIQTEQAQLDERLSMVIEDGQSLQQIIMQNTDGQALSYERYNWNDNDLLITGSLQLATNTGNTQNQAVLGNLSCYPNPFNPKTVIAYNLKQNDRVKLAVYNIKGQLVKQLVNNAQKAGNYQVEWNGTDNYGKPAASGVYFYRLQAGKTSLVKKMMLMK